MPGAWEQSSFVLCVVLHTDITSIAWAFGLRNLKIPGQVIGLAGMTYDHARNAGAMQALDAGATHVFFLDSDIIPPPDAILKLLAHNQPIISGLYCRRSPPVGVPVMQRPPGQWITQYPANQVIDVDVVGAGCLLIRRDVLEKLPPQRPEAGKHWFDWRVDTQGCPITNGIPPMSEDFTFCLHAKKMGYPILVDTSVVCRHVGLAQSAYQRFEPLDAHVLA